MLEGIPNWPYCWLGVLGLNIEDDGMKARLVVFPIILGHGSCFEGPVGPF